MARTERDGELLRGIALRYGVVRFTSTCLVWAWKGAWLEAASPLARTGPPRGSPLDVPRCLLYGGARYAKGRAGGKRPRGVHT